MLYKVNKKNTSQFILPIKRIKENENFKRQNTE